MTGLHEFADAADNPRVDAAVERDQIRRHADAIDRAATTLADLGYAGLADELSEAGDTFRDTSEQDRRSAEKAAPRHIIREAETASPVQRRRRKAGK